METKFIDKLTEEVWGNRGSVPVIAIVSILAGIPLELKIMSFFSHTVAEGNVSYTKISEYGIWISVLVWLCILILNYRQNSKTKIEIEMYMSTENSVNDLFLS